MRCTPRKLGALLLGVWMAMPALVSAQLQVTPSTNANALAQSLVGQGVSVSNATLFGSPGQAGFFDGTNSNIGINSGIILSSGDVTLAPGPNTSGNTSGNFGGPGYPLLTQLAGVPTNDRCVLQFDVVPYADTLTFRYVFASEEYPEFVCSNFNDAFAFFISGPNPSGPAYVDQNVALIPGTTIGVAINSVNSGTPGGLFPSSGCTSLSYSSYYVSNNNGATVEYDGFTRSLIARLVVVPCSTYTFKLAIADGGLNDFVYDSSVFLEEGSLTATGASVDSRTTLGPSYTSVIEGCLDGEIVFRRNNSNNGSPLTVDITTGGSATNGIDYTTIPNVVTIPAGQDSVVLNIQAFQDNLNEGFESLIVYLMSPCQGTVLDSTLIYIEDSLSLQVLPGDTTICKGESVQLLAIGGGNFNWSPPAGLNVTFISSPTATPDSTTTYTVSSSIQSCTATATIPITVNDLPDILLDSDTSICSGQSIQINANVTPGASIQWSPSNGLNNTTIPNPLAIPSSTTTYTLTATTGQTCTSQDSIEIVVHPAPNAYAGTDTTICMGDSTPLQATGGVSYQWSPPAGLSDASMASPVAGPTVTTNYSVLVTDSNGCVADDVVKITVNPLPLVDAGPDQNICPGSYTQLQATGATSYQWSPTASLNSPSVSNPVAGPAQTTIYTVVGTHANGCSAQDTVSVQVAPTPNTSVVASAPGTCPGGSIQLTATGGDTYSWQTGIPGLSSYSIANPTATPATTTKYYVSVSDNSTGCTALDSVTVQVYPLPNVQVSANDTLCLGESKVLQASGASTYTWMPAATLSAGTGNTVTATPTSTTQYTVTGTDNRGCVNTAQVQINVNPLPTANAGQDRTACKGSLLQLSGSGGGSYSWSPSLGLSCTQCSNPALVATATTNYVLKVTDANGCIDRDTLGISVLPLPPVEAGPDVTLCPNGTTTLQASGAVSYTWSPGTGLSSTTVSNPTAAPTSATTYTVTGVDANNCTNIDSVRVDFYPFTPVSAGPDVSICNGDSTQLQGKNAAQYTWSPAASLSDSNVSNPSATPTTTTTYTLNAADANGCTSTDHVKVTVRPLPNIVLTQGDTTLCVDKSVQLGATGGISYDWTPATGLSDPTIANPIANPANSTEYTLTVVNVENCSAEETVRIDRYPVTDPNAQPAVTAICPGESVQLSSENGVTYAWVPALGLSNSVAADPLATPDSSTVYTLTIEDINGCIFTDEVDITVHPTPIADAGQDGSVFIGDSYPLQGSGNGNFTWTPDRWIDFRYSSNPVATPDSSIWYTLTVVTPKGCVASDSVYVRVYYETKVFMPNAFSPNGDGQNDVFGPKWYNEFELADFRIYNRWGALMYNSRDANSGWDGTVNGEPQPVGTYIYVLRGVGNRGEPFIQEGKVILLR